jgi:acetyl esterase/lipase
MGCEFAPTKPQSYSILTSEEKMTKKYSSIHPELQSIAKMMPALRFTKGNLPLMRLVFTLPFLFPKTHPDVRIEEHTIKSGDIKSRLRLRIYKPKNACVPLPVLVWMHGGGYVVGNLNQSDEILLQFVRETGIAAVSVDYRLAPENPFPAALDDVYCALKWVHDQANTLGIDPNRIAVGGESAGGGLAAALAQLACDQREVKPIFQLLVYPMLDDHTCASPEETEQDYIVWTPASNRFGWKSYLHQTPGSASVSPGSVPARRVDLTGLPSAWIGVGTIDLFHDEDVVYAKRLQACGVDCELVTVPGAFHGFDSANPNLPVARAFRQAQIEALKKHLFPPVS